jgi:hydroxypyruvate reductase
LNLRYSDHQKHSDFVLRSVLEACDPGLILAGSLRHQSGILSINDHQVSVQHTSGIHLLAVGKAATPMIQATVDVLGGTYTRAIVVRPEADRTTLPADWQVFQAGHPLPTRESLAAGDAIAGAIRSLDDQDLILLLLSGGGSALLELPKAGISLEDLRRVNLDLLRSGAPIEEVNTVRKSMSRIKAGGLARMAAPARGLALILSDVIGDDLGLIASGPMVPERINNTRAQEILASYGLWERYSQRFHKALLSDYPASEPNDPPVNIVIANNETARAAAARAGKELGFRVETPEKPLAGEARSAGAAFARRLKDLVERHPEESVCLVQGGETTVTVRGEGKGGRNQEFAVGAARELQCADRLAVLSFATDGVDGPTDSAGALVDSTTIPRTLAMGLNVENHLDQNNVYTLLDRVGGLIRTGPTQTNLNDIAVGFGYVER